MEPIILALLTLVATKATEKIGDQVGEGAIASAKRLLEVLRRRSPETVKRLELAGGAGDSDVIDAQIIEEVMQVAQNDPAVQTAVKATTEAVAADPSAFQALTKLADKIGVINLAPVQNQTFNQTF